MPKVTEEIKSDLVVSTLPNKLLTLSDEIVNENNPDEIKPANEIDLKETGNKDVQIRFSIVDLLKNLKTRLNPKTNHVTTVTSVLDSKEWFDKMKLKDPLLTNKRNM